MAGLKNPIGDPLLQPFICNTTGIENYVKARMFSTLPSTEYVPLSIEKLTCKIIYSNLLNYQHFPPPTAEKRLEYGFNFQERKKIYSLPFRVTNEVKLFAFHCKIVHNILNTNKILYKMKKKQ